jgi:hypothetical protein
MSSAVIEMLAELEKRHAAQRAQLEVQLSAAQLAGREDEGRRLAQ